MLITVEGLDGAGKNTLTSALSDAWRARGLSVAQVAFPRYGRSVHADVAAESLHGAFDGRIAADPLGMALLFALDRHEAKGELETLARAHDIVLCDRYVASNAAYGAARLGEDGAGPFASWVLEFEFGRLGLPKPDRQLLLATPPGLAAQRARARAASDPGRERDSYERDAELQERVGSVYAHLAETGWAGQWRVVAPDSGPAALAAELV
ncbi:MAG: dTMP kinase [Segniliparus sp.]|uniref:dTMP kinase n=1 Tax=Segniliparus sp. TaxID=2804064 RepID=UPI003F3E6A69